MNDDDQLVDMYLTRNALRQQTLEAETEDPEAPELQRMGTRMSTIFSQVNLEGSNMERQATMQRLKSLEEPYSPTRCVGDAVFVHDCGCCNGEVYS